MIKTQVQFPDALYREAKRLAKEREMSLAEVVRQALELFLDRYRHAAPKTSTWHPPKPRNLGCRPLTAAQLRDALSDAESLRSLRVKA